MCQRHINLTAVCITMERNTMLSKYGGEWEQKYIYFIVFYFLFGMDYVCLCLMIGLRFVYSLFSDVAGLHHKSTLILTCIQMSDLT